jgi:type I restriction enzyme S subunit
VSDLALHEKVTSTGGRHATTRHIPPLLALAVGQPVAAPPPRWQWQALTDLARLESGHTPSRRQESYWGGSIPWISIRDAKEHHGGVVERTIENTNDLGIANSSARVLPAGTVCLSRTASVGYVVLTSCEMATSQDFVNWVCGDRLEPRFLQYLFVAEGRDLLRFASGAVHQTIYFPEAKAFFICAPEREEQRRIVTILDEAFEGIATAKANAEKNLQNARELFGRLSAAVLDQLAPISRTATLEDMAEPGCSLSYGIVQPGEEVAGGLPIVRPVDLNDGVVTLDGLKRIDPALAKSYDRTILKGNDILLCVRGTTGALALAHSELAGANVTRGIVPIRFDAAQLSQDFGHCLMRSEPVQMQIRAKTYGTALMQINIRDLRRLTLPVPPKHEQDVAVKRFDELNAATDQLVATYQRKLTALAELKKSLLHQAFSGQL